MYVQGQNSEKRCEVSVVESNCGRVHVGEADKARLTGVRSSAASEGYKRQGGRLQRQENTVYRERTHSTNTFYIERTHSNGGRLQKAHILSVEREHILSGENAGGTRMVVSWEREHILTVVSWDREDILSVQRQQTHPPSPVIPISLTLLFLINFLPCTHHFALHGRRGQAK